MRNVLPVLTDLPRIGQGLHPAPGLLDVHIWYYYHGVAMGPQQIEALLALLSPDECVRFTRLRDDRRRRHFLVGRALCRRALSRYAPVWPKEWRFELGSRGKPSISAPVLSTPLWFSLSHADGVSICAVTGAGPQIGIDIERIAPDSDRLEIAAQFFPAPEVNALRGLPPAQQGEGFVHIWALKEAFVKARETSLTDGLCSTSFDLARLDDIGVAFADSLREKAEHWRFKLLQLDDVLIFALAMRTHASGSLRLRAGICLMQ